MKKNSKQAKANSTKPEAATVKVMPAATVVTESVGRAARVMKPKAVTINPANGHEPEAPAFQYNKSEKAEAAKVSHAFPIFDLLTVPTEVQMIDQLRLEALLMETPCRANLMDRLDSVFPFRTGQLLYYTFHRLDDALAAMIFPSMLTVGICVHRTSRGNIMHFETATERVVVCVNKETGLIEDIVDGYDVNARPFDTSRNESIVTSALGSLVVLLDLKQNKDSTLMISGGAMGHSGFVMTIAHQADRFVANEQREVVIYETDNKLRFGVCMSHKVTEPNGEVLEIGRTIGHYPLAEIYQAAEDIVGFFRPIVTSSPESVSEKPPTLHTRWEEKDAPYEYNSSSITPVLPAEIIGGSLKM